MPKRKAEVERRPLRAEDVWSIPVPSEPDISANGRQVAYVLTFADRDDDGYRSCIWTVATKGGAPRQLTNGPGDTSPAWSPDGKRLAFLRRSAGKPAQLHVLPVGAGGEPNELTDLPLGAGAPVWAPDGKRIAFTAPVDLSARGTSGRDPKKPDPKKPDPKKPGPVVVDRLGYKADGAGLLGSLRRHLFVVDVDAGAPPAQVTFGERSASTPVWSPDGSLLAYSSAEGDDVDLSPNSVVHTVPASGGQPTALSPPTGLYQVADWSDDGATLLLAGRPELRAGHDRLYSLPVAGGDPVCLTGGFDRNVMAGAPGYPGTAPRYTSDGQRILFCARERGAIHLLEIPSAGGEPTTVAGGARVVAGASEGAGRVAFVAAGTMTPGEVWTSSTPAEGDRDGRRLTDHFRTALPEVELIEAEEVSFVAPDGTDLHGFMVRPPAAEGPAALLLDVHGGPHNAWGPAFDAVHVYQQTLAASGWTVLMLNPRGSDGYGESFYTSVCGGWGENDEDDFLCAVDSLVERGIADPEHLAVSGYSYGGYTTCWLTARHRKFAAAVTGGCVSNLVSLAGTSDMGRHLAELEIGATLPDGRDTLARLSPLSYVEGARTPTLILHGERDDRCPVSQAEEWFSALRAARVPVEMVRYPGAGHLFILSGPPSQRVDYSKRVDRWVRQHAGVQPSLRSRRSLRSRPSVQVGSGDLSARLGDLIRRHDVPGASVAVLAGGETTAAAAGVLNLNSGAGADPDSLFQIGSISKVYTTTVVMQLADEGLIDLDGPVVEVLPELQLADPDVTKTLTMRQLLTHTSGIEGDHFADTGRGDDCLARYVASCAELGQSHPLGATMSYCNSGFVIAGRVIEVLTGGTWDEAMRERLFAPLGLQRTVTLPEEVLRFAGSVGHVGKAGAQEVAPVWGLPRASGPAGLICASASDVVAFAKMHLEKGLSPSGARVLSEASVSAMQQPQVAVPDPHTLGSHWGVGWILFDWDGRRLFGHDGNTIGQSAFLRVVPDAGVAIALLTNGGNAQDLYRELYADLLREIAGVEMPARPAPPARPVESRLDLGVHAGTYERLGMTASVAVENGKLVMTTTATGPLASLLPDPTTRHDLVAVDQDLYVTRQPGVETWMPVVFYRLDDGARYVHMGARATPKTA